jgi:pyruvate,water dikinase
MNLVIPLTSLADAHLHQVGAKAFNIGVMFLSGVRVPRTLCITQDAYETYVRSTGLMERISLELGRKDFRDMRWEELRDTSLRIRNMFLNTAMPGHLVKKIREPLEELFGEDPVAVRSSAPGEDAVSISFAGLHESYLGVRGIYCILDHIRLVWASLWSDTAMLYRKELGLDIHHSTMAVLIQDLVVGLKSGSVLSRDPSHEDRSVIEAIYGLNQALVDGTVNPDRWAVDRATGEIISHEGALRDKALMPSATGVSLEALPAELWAVPPLDRQEIREVYQLALTVEALFGTPLEVEWTLDRTGLYALQSRSIPASARRVSADIRNSSRSLSRSFENLKQLKARIEEELIPGMIEEATAMVRSDLEALSSHELAAEITDMTARYQVWERAYWKYFISFANGMRLFGRVYNDTVRPHDPYEFMDLLRSQGVLSIERNTRLESLADQVRRSPALAGALREGADTSGFPRFEDDMKRFVEKFGNLSCYGSRCVRDDGNLKAVVLKLAMKTPPPVKSRIQAMEDLEEYYLSFFPPERKSFARELLSLAREGYRLRDNDDVYLGRIKGQHRAVLDEGRRRLSGTWPRIRDADISKALTDPSFMPAPEEEPSTRTPTGGVRLKARQLVGQPAGSGMATGKARVLTGGDDLIAFEAGEVVICDALEPDMTFIIPLASGIVEQRGGMLIHGAIIAREYGLPCVTGVADALSLIRTGSGVTVDGHLGIVIIHD